MSPPDRESLIYKIEKIRDALRVLRKLGRLPYREYAKNFEHKMTAERLLQVGIEAMLDTGNHIIAAEGLKAPLEYREVFVILRRAGILSNKHSGRFQGMVGLRNRLVHEYTEIDHAKIHEILKNDLGDFETYVRSILRYLKKGSGRRRS